MVEGNRKIVKKVCNNNNQQAWANNKCNNVNGYGNSSVSSNCSNNKLDIEDTRNIKFGKSATCRDIAGKNQQKQQQHRLLQQRRIVACIVTQSCMPHTYICTYEHNCFQVSGGTWASLTEMHVRPDHRTLGSLKRICTPMRPPIPVSCLIAYYCTKSSRTPPQNASGRSMQQRST